MQYIVYLYLFLTPFLIYAKTYHKLIDLKQKEIIWECREVEPFDELIVSWNGFRPNTGHYLIQVSLLTDQWSPWMNYASWGVQTQKSFKESYGHIETYQDTVTIHQALAKGFKVRVLSEQACQIHALHASAIHQKNHLIRLPTLKETVVLLTCAIF